VDQVTQAHISDMVLENGGLAAAVLQLHWQCSYTNCASKGLQDPFPIKFTQFGAALQLCWGGVFGNF
jgi:hypothetical protein